jgi:hypothetical protein
LFSFSLDPRPTHPMSYTPSDNMAASPQAPYSHSMYLLPPRPAVSRQRSNSLPVGLATMNAQEADMIFSAAEKATARRRRIASVDHAALVEEDVPDNTGFSPLPTTSTIKPSPLRNVTTQKRDRPSTSESVQTIIAHSRGLCDLDPNQQSDGEKSPSATSPTEFIFKSLPVSPVSPTKRLVQTRSLKNYADGLFQFTQTRLVSHIPQIGSPTFENNFDELDSSTSTSTHTARPSLDSHFSDWSISTRDVESRRSSLAGQDTPPVEIDPALLSPDAFFSTFEDTPRRKNFNIRLSNNSGYASSETYDPPSGLPPPTPPSRYSKSQAEDFSYFTNFDKYIDQDAIVEADSINLEPPESLAIKLSPIEVLNSPYTPPAPAFRRRADTAIRAPLLSSSCSGTPGSQFGHHSPSSALQIAQVAVQVPHWLIGAIS